MTSVPFQMTPPTNITPDDPCTNQVATTPTYSWINIYEVLLHLPIIPLKLSDATAPITFVNIFQILFISPVRDQDP